MKKEAAGGPNPRRRRRAGCQTLAELVERYGLRYAHAPDRPYPVEGNYGLPEGWVPLVERLVQRLIRLGWDRRLAQVKPKLGGLRFYVGARTAPVFQAIQRASRRAERTCSSCGRPGELREDGPMDPRCVEHADPGAEKPPTSPVASTSVPVEGEPSRRRRKARGGRPKC